MYGFAFLKVLYVDNCLLIIFSKQYHTSIEPVPSNNCVVTRILPPDPPPCVLDPACPLELSVPSTLASVVRLRYIIPPPQPPQLKRKIYSEIFIQIS